MTKRRKIGDSPFQPASIQVRRKPIAKKGRFPGIRNLGPVVSKPKALKATVIGTGPVYTDQKGRQVRVVNLWERENPK